MPEPLRSRYLRDFRRLRRLALAAAKQCDHYERLASADGYVLEAEAYEELARALLVSARLREALVVAERIRRRVSDTRRWGLPVGEAGRG